MSNFAAVYGMPTYAGVDSDQNQDFVNFLSNFRTLDPSWYFRAGITSSIVNKRALDLFGVGYDLLPDGSFIFRPDAIPRVAAFSGFEVQTDRELALKRLKSADFDPTQSVLLDHRPDIVGLRAQAKRFQKLVYTTPDADELQISIDAGMPRIILFNDRFAPGWQATWNGTPLRIQRANTLFMAVALPPGAGNLVFNFHPRQFFLLVKIAVLAAIFITFLVGVLIFRKVKSGQLQRKQPEIKAGMAYSSGDQANT